MKKILLTIPLLVNISLVQAEAINLECNELANKMVAQLLAEGLLNSPQQSQERAREISTELCQGVQQSAESQHQKAQTSALQNWIFENRPDKPGNKRLKRLK